MIATERSLQNQTLYTPGSLPPPSYDAVGYEVDGRSRLVVHLEFVDRSGSVDDLIRGR